MKRGAFYLLLCLLLVAAAPVRAGRPAPTALYFDHFEDTALLAEVDNLTAAGSFLQVPAEVRWVQDTLADFYPGAGSGVDLYAQPGAILLSRFTPDRRVDDSAVGLQTDVAVTYARQLAGGIQDVPGLYAAWADGRGDDLDIYVSRSTDGGATWSASQRANTVHTAGDQRRPALAAIGSNVYVAWEGDEGVYFSRSPDGGNTWSEDTLLAAGGRDPQLAAGRVMSVNTLYLVYVAEESPDDPDIYARRSSTNGFSWEEPVNVVVAEPAGAWQGAPTVAMPADTDEVWAAWVDGRNGELDLYAGRRAGTLWSNVRVDNGPSGSSPGEPALFYPAGLPPVHCVWVDDRQAEGALYWARYDIILGWLEGGAIPFTAGARAPAAKGMIGNGAWAGWNVTLPGPDHTAWASRYYGYTWGTPAIASDHRPGTSRSAVAVAQADLPGAMVAVFWSDDRNDAGDIYAAVSDGNYSSTGVYTSTVRRFGELAGWGDISWTGSELAYLTVEVRGGDTPVPDAGWSPWTAAANGGPVPLAPAAYLQYRVRLQPTLSGNSPAFESLQVTAFPRRGSAVSVPVGRCVASWGEFASEGYAPSGTTLTLSLLDLGGSVIVSDVVTPYDLSGLSPARYPRLRLRVDMQRSNVTPLLNWWQVSWEEGVTQAGFAFEPPVVYTPTVVQFTNLSTATVLPLTYTWEFGDGSATTQEHPTHTFALPGAYTVTLRAAGECGEDAFTETLGVLPLPTVPPVAALAHGPLCVGQEITFSNRSADAVWWHWDLGDGQGSARFHPTHVYGAAGDYTLTLAVTNTVGSDRAAELLAVRPAPTAAFTWSAELLTVAFTSSVSGDPALRWDFGDGLTSTLPHPVHTYTASGSYSVSLAAANACSRATAIGRVEVFCAPAAVLSFSWQPAAPAPGEVITFTALVSGSPPLALEWAWSDGGTARGPIVTRTLDLPGTYAVTLTAGNPCGQAMAAGRVRVARPVHRAFLPLVARQFYAGDAFEPDGSPEQGRPLSLASPQRHDFGMPGDIDWVYLEAEAGTRYTVRTSDLTGEADTWIYLYAPGSYGAPLLSNDDCDAYTRASCLTFVPTVTGRYELQVTNIVGRWGPGVQYTLEARRE